ncbi:hypothetical protein [Pontibacter oryzae]|uniref:Lipoprotein n=1 Tax=Pontibacter oryzae TaxID=2304593 RepID=A0A399SDW1_9BACT|nr:hypothetical protein [Pontibacter oryzae]RIJ41870.1 hypothetical protein D1627_07630 [Pontibacter oryzae]
MRKIIYLFTLLSLFSCGPQTQQEPASLQHTTDHEVLEQDTSIQQANSLEGVFSPTLDTLALSPAPATLWKLLMEGTYHKKEVFKGAERLEWFGLYFKDGNYTLEPTKVTVNVVKDPVAEKIKGVLSGRQVISSLPDAAFLVAALKGIKAGTVDTARYSRTTMPANQQLNILFRNKEYTISAYADSTAADIKTYTYTRYGWRIRGKRNGRMLTQTLAEDVDFEDSIYVLLWAGDLDRDGIPDLLIDLSNHYNVSRYTLFLSSLAEPGKLYKKAAVFETVGA